MRSAAEMAELFRDQPEAIANTERIAERCQFDLTRDLDYRFPDYPAPPGETPQSYLRNICQQAAALRPPATRSRSPSTHTPAARVR